MRILITGARGFLGSSIAEYATDQGHSILGLGRSAQPPPKWPGQYAWADAAQTDLTPIIDGYVPDLLFHGAGSASVGASFSAPLDDLRASVLTFANVLDGVRRSQTRPVVLFPSSAAVYGNPQRIPISEDDPTVPISPYGFHKLSAEQLGREYATCHGLQVVIGRIFSVIGPRQRRLLLWEIFEQFSSAASDIVLQGTGSEVRDYVHIEDLARAFLALGQTAKADLANGRCVTVNVGSGIGTSVRTVAEISGNILDAHRAIRFANNSRTGDPQRWVADLTRFKEMNCRVDFRSAMQAIQQTISVWTGHRVRSFGTRS